MKCLICHQWRGLYTKFNLIIWIKKFHDILIDVLWFLEIYRFPFDWQTPTGYILAMSIQYIQTVYTFLFANSAFAMGLSSYLIANVVADDIKINLNLMNVDVKIAKNRLKTIQQIYDFIEVHSFLQELSEWCFFLFFNITFWILFSCF